MDFDSSHKTFNKYSFSYINQLQFHEVPNQEDSLEIIVDKLNIF